MRARQFLLFAFTAAAIVFTACKKNRISSVINPPENPGTDTTINPTNPDTSRPEPATYQQVAVHVSIDNNVGGYYEALPPAYDSNDNKYPLLLFLHGGGELGDGGENDLPKILKNSVTRRLADKSLPYTFSSNGKDYSFIIISPQFKDWPTVENVHNIMLHVLGKYRIDTTRIYLAGLSMGGAATWDYAGSEYGKKLAAIVPICGANWADSSVAVRIAKNEIPAWAFHNLDDSAVTVNSTKRYVRLIDGAHPKYPVRVTYWPTGGHDAWTKASDPEYREDGKNMYEWMLQFVR